MRKKQPEDHAAAQQKCAKCGACTVVCPVYRASGNEIYSARGKIHLAEVYKDDQPGPVFEDIYSKCLLCGACSQVCPSKIDIPGKVVDARADFSAMYGEHGYQKFLARKVLNRPELLGAARVLGSRAAAILLGRLPAASGLRLRLAMFGGAPSMPGRERAAENIVLPRRVETGDKTTITYFPGCTARYLYPDIVDSIHELLHDFGYTLNIPAGLGCCGLAANAAGHPDESRQQARKNIRLLEQGDGPILLSCGSCFAQLAAYRELFADDPDYRVRAELVSERVVEISSFVQILLQEPPDGADTGSQTSSQRLRVFYHDPCHMRHGRTITEEPRSVLRRLPDIELVELPDGPQCCGQGGLFHIGAPELSARIRDDLAEKVLELQPDVITTSCSGCLMQLKTAVAAADRDVPVIHFAALVNARR